MVHTCNPSNLGGGDRRIKSSKSSSATEWVSGQPRLPETLSQRERRGERDRGGKIAKKERMRGGGAAPSVYGALAVSGPP